MQPHGRLRGQPHGLGVGLTASQASGSLPRGCNYDTPNDTGYDTPNDTDNDTRKRLTAKRFRGTYDTDYDTDYDTESSTPLPINNNKKRILLRLPKHTPCPRPATRQRARTHCARLPQGYGLATLGQLPATCLA